MYEHVAHGGDTRRGRDGIPGLYVTEDPGAKERARSGLMMAILNDRIQIAKAVNVDVIPLDKAPDAYQAFDAGVPKKFVIDPHDTLA